MTRFEINGFRVGDIIWHKFDGKRVVSDVTDPYSVKYQDGDVAIRHCLVGLLEMGLAKLERLA